VWLDELGKLKKSNDLFGNQTHNLLACSIVPQSTMLPRAPSQIMTDKNYKNTKGKKYESKKCSAMPQHSTYKTVTWWKISVSRVEIRVELMLLTCFIH
jgi:hypothetical protein